MRTTLGLLRTRLLAFVTLATFATACGDGDGGTSPDPEVTVSVSASSTTVPAAGNATVTASVTNASNTAVTWSATGGTFDGSGTTVTWQAPATGGAYTITATSTADPSRSGSVSVTVSQATVAISPSTAVLYRGQPQLFTATVSGVAAGAGQVEWNTSCGAGEADGSSFTYVAPETPGACTVTAVSVLDPSRSADASAAVRDAWLVTSLGDADDSACTWDHCSFREALAAAQAAPGPDTIVLGTDAGSAAPSTSSGTRVAGRVALTGTIVLAGNLPVISTPVSIVGPGPDLLAIDAGATPSDPRRVFNFAGSQSEVVGLTIRGGHTPAAGGVALADGSDVTFRGVVITDNESTVGAGGGLGLIGQSTARLIDSSVDGNRANGASAAAGGIELVQNSTLTMQGGSVSGNSVPQGWGGGIRVFDGTVELDGVVIENNTAGLAAGGGGIMAEGAGSLTVLNSRISTNATAGGGGGLWIRGTIDASVSESVVADNDATGGAGGGAIWLDGDATLAIAGTELTGNTTSSEGGALRLVQNASATVEGGVIMGNGANTAGAIGVGNASTLVMTGTVIRENTAASRGGAFFVWGSSEVRLSEVEIVSNIAQGNGGFGGGSGIYAQNQTVLELEDVLVAENVSQLVGFGGGLALWDGTTATLSGGAIRDNVTVDGAGGGIFGRNTTVVLEGVSVRDNRAFIQGGGLQFLEASAVEIVGGEFVGNRVTNEATNAFGGAIGAFGTTQLTLTGTTVATNVSPASGGAIFIAVAASAQITGGSFENNEAVATGGAIFKGGTGTLTIEDAAFSNNTAGAQGGALQLTGAGAVTLDRLRVEGNLATASGGGGMTIGTPGSVRNSVFANNTSGGTGGAIFSSSTGTATFENLTLSGNSAVIGGGMGITGSPTLRSLTIALNTASDFGGGIGSNNAGVASLVNVLLSGNLGPGGAAANCGLGGGGMIASQGHNLSDDASCGTLSEPTDLGDTAAGLDALADNGGATATHALLQGSAAIDAGLAGACPTADQRGFTRVGTCDIGAFEFGASAPAPVVRR